MDIVFNNDTAEDGGSHESSVLVEDSQAVIGDQGRRGRSVPQLGLGWVIGSATKLLPFFSKVFVRHCVDQVISI